jgi:hypothetical protein
MVWGEEGHEGEATHGIEGVESHGGHSRPSWCQTFNPAEAAAEGLRIFRVEAI